MSKDLNQCQFIGRLGKDPDIKSTSNGNSVANFSIAVGDDYKTKSGEKVEQTEWVNLFAFGRLAEIIGEYLHKGSKVYVSGKMKTEKYEKDGIDRWSTKVQVFDLQMLEGKSDSGGQPQARQTSAATNEVKKPVDDDFGGDLPF